MLLHKKVSLVEETDDPDKVGSQHWNEGHVYGAGSVVPWCIGDADYNSGTFGKSVTNYYSSSNNGPGDYTIVFEPVPESMVAPGCVVNYLPIVSLSSMGESNRRLVTGIATVSGKPALRLYYESISDPGARYHPSAYLGMAITVFASVSLDA